MSSEALAQTKAQFLKATADQASAMALSFEDPAALARNLAAWIRQNFPERVAEAYWITAEKQTDKGIEVKIFEKPLSLLGGMSLRFGALLGMRSGGVSVTVPLVTSSGGIQIGVGIGAVADWNDFSKFQPVLVLRASF